MSTNHRPRAVLFDMDGVLLDSVDSWLGVVNEVRVDFGFDPITQAHLLTIFGQGVEDDAKNLYPGHPTAAIRRAYDDAMPRYVDRVRPGPDTREVLAALEQAGIHRAVVTNTQHTLADAMLEAAGLEGCFERVAAAGGKERAKPHPDMLRRALAHVDGPPSGAGMVGDTHYDEQAAVAAGVGYLHFDLRRGGRLRDALGAWLD